MQGRRWRLPCCCRCLVARPAADRPLAPLPALPGTVGEPRFALGEMVVHTAKGYRGVVAGWDLACCEGTEWQAAAGVRCAAAAAHAPA